MEVFITLPPGKTDGGGDMKALLGGKGANLAQMTKIGLPVPSGFTITTEVCVNYYKNGRKAPAELAVEMEKAVKWLEKEAGKKFGDVKNPLLVSVRSGARDSMPGMMDTILNLGLNDATCEGLAAAVRFGDLPGADRCWPCGNKVDRHLMQRSKQTAIAGERESIHDH